jgi:microcystin-dependent protein
MDGNEVPCTGGSAVNAALCSQLISLYGSANYKGTPAATITVDPTSDEVVHTAHARVVNDRVHFSTTGTLPSPLNATTVYCVQSVTADRYKLKACGGANIDITTSGTGSHSDYFNMKIPDTRGRNVLGTGTGTGLTARVIGATGGEEAHLLTAAESGLPAHNHTVSRFANADGSPGNIANTSNASAMGTTTTSTNTAASASSTHNVMDPFIVMTYIIKL